MLVRPELCTYCLACEDVCPVNAIALPFEIVFLQPAVSNSDSANSK